MGLGEFSVECKLRHRRYLKFTYADTLMLFIILGGVGCGGASVNQPATTLTEPSQTNLIQFNGELGTTIRLQFWQPKAALPIATFKERKQCPEAKLKLQFLERPEAVGVSIEGFPNEIEETLTTILTEKRCLAEYINLPPSLSKKSWLPRLGQHLDDGKFAVVSVLSSKPITQNLQALLQDLVMAPPSGLVTLHPTPKPLGLDTYETKTGGELEIHLTIFLRTAWELAQLELAESALSSALSDASSAQFQPHFKTASIQPNQDGTFSLKLLFDTPTHSIKSEIPVVLSLVTNGIEGWASPLRLLEARKKSLEQLAFETEKPRHYLERTARTNLIFGADGPKQWLDGLRNVGHSEWLSAIKPWFHRKHLSVRVGMSKHTMSDPDFALAFFTEALNEKVKLAGQAIEVPAAANPIHHVLAVQRQIPRQVLRIAIGLTPKARETLTPYILSNVQQCLHNGSKRSVSVGLFAATLIVQTEVKPGELNGLLQDLDTMFATPCPPTVLPSKSRSSAQFLDVLHRALNPDDDRPDSTGTSIKSTDDRLSPRVWWQRLLADEPPLQVFSVGPMPLDLFHHTLSTWRPWTRPKAWLQADMPTRVGRELSAHRSIKYEGQLLVPMPKLSPRRRIMLDAICVLLANDEASPAQCSRARSAYLAGLDVLLFAPKAPVTAANIRQQLKRYFFEAGKNNSAEVRAAVRSAVLEHERRANASTTTVAWLQNVVWEPDQPWRSKMVWDGLFPDENADLELVAMMKMMATQRL